ncbi:DUF3800 domain-containing protein [Methanobrevibacter millerae]|uniref:DUF3800 domain-containing protein n=1 Tax=Methanobrevibacter millerae TaxID=230361 RepID=A0A1G5VIP2_9EURY|nr:DUF3800 domain-containing protein [Methanobrevibacter millerae]SDA45722.1 Protein of unknown function [Methanobrevibacter millerae]
MKYIYIDESGDLGEKYSSSKFFVIGAIIVNNPKNLNRIIKDARKKYNNIIGRDLEIKGNKTNRYVIKKILEKINNIEYQVLAIFLDKQNLNKIPNFYNHHLLYDTLASKLSEKIIITSPTTVIIDRSKSKHEDIRIFNERFLSSLNNPNNYQININHANSIKEKGLQTADLIAWSVFQSLEHENSEFIDLIKNKNIYEVFK